MIGTAFKYRSVHLKTGEPNAGKRAKSLSIIYTAKGLNMQIRYTDKDKIHGNILNVLLAYIVLNS